jgi:hypothetical protein
MSTCLCRASEIKTGELVHRPANASLETRAGGLWLTVDSTIGQHVNLCLIERRPIEVDGVSYGVRERRARPGEAIGAFRLVRL